MTIKNKFIIMLLIGMMVLSPTAASARVTVFSEDSPQAPMASGTTIWLPQVIARPAAQTSGAMVIDHNAIAQFDRIPDSYIQAASSIRFLFRHASVGWNISEGLNCMMNSVSPRPFFCDAGLQGSQIIYNPKYNRNNWTFEFHAPPPGQNPGWWDKAWLFIDRVDSTSNYDAYGFKFGYVDAIQGSAIDDEFFAYHPGDQFPSIHDMEALEASHPGKRFVYWTMGLARIVGTPDSQSFNQQMRTYASQHNKILMDIADITSHRPNGSACYTAPGSGIEIICDEYTDENEGGHLNALGMQVMSKAMWVLMARMAGWSGN